MCLWGIRRSSQTVKMGWEDIGDVVVIGSDELVSDIGDDVVRDYKYEIRVVACV